MAAGGAKISEEEAFALMQKAFAAHRMTLFTDPAILNRQGSPLFNPLETFAPLLILLASSMTLLLAFGLVEWIIGLALVLVLQTFVIKKLNEWRFHRRAVRMALSSLYNFRLLWSMGGLVLALKDWPGKNCVAPGGNWKSFVAHYIGESPENALK